LDIGCPFTVAAIKLPLNFHNNTITTSKRTKIIFLTVKNEESEKPFVEEMLFSFKFSLYLASLTELVILLFLAIRLFNILYSMIFCNIQKSINIEK